MGAGGLVRAAGAGRGDGMEIIELLKAALFGVVEGITEWLPISSTGHMLLLDQFVTLDVSEGFWNMFLVVIQLGAILAVCVLYFHQLNPFSPSKTREERRGTWSLWAKIIVACLPAALIGIPLDDWMEEHLSGPLVIAAALIVYGIVFIVIESVRERRALALAEHASHAPRPRHLKVVDEAEVAGESMAELADADAPVRSVADLGMARALGIGCFQILSLVPGTSRSGSTIIGGLVLGCTRTVAAEFTFFLAIPVMVGASALRIAKFVLAGNILTSGELAILGVGCAVAFVVSILAIRFLMGFVRRHDFKPFGWYRIVLGIVVIAYFTLVG